MEINKDYPVRSTGSCLWPSWSSSGCHPRHAYLKPSLTGDPAASFWVHRDGIALSVCLCPQAVALEGLRVILEMPRIVRALAQSHTITPCGWFLISADKIVLWWNPQTWVKRAAWWPSLSLLQFYRGESAATWLKPGAVTLAKVWGFCLICLWHFWIDGVAGFSADQSCAFKNSRTQQWASQGFTPSPSPHQAR